MGDFGRWQAFICVSISLLKVSVAWHQLAILFLAPPQDFWCARPPGKRGRGGSLKQFCLNWTHSYELRYLIEYLSLYSCRTLQRKRRMVAQQQQPQSNGPRSVRALQFYGARPGPGFGCLQHRSRGHSLLGMGVWFLSIFRHYRVWLEPSLRSWNARSRRTNCLYVRDTGRQLHFWRHCWQVHSAFILSNHMAESPN